MSSQKANTPLGLHNILVAEFQKPNKMCQEPHLALPLEGLSHTLALPIGERPEPFIREIERWGMGLVTYQKVQENRGEDFVDYEILDIAPFYG